MRSDHAYHRRISLFVALGALSLLIVACGADGGDSSGVREAAGKSCPDKYSDELEFPVENYLDTPVILRGYNVDCSDWSGVSTPSNTFDDLRLEPGERETVRLEVVEREGKSPSYFDLEVTLADASLALGSARMTADSYTGIGLVGNVEKVPTQKDWTSGYLLLKSLSSTDANGINLEKLDLVKGFGIVPYEGKIQVVAEPGRSRKPHQ